MLSKTDLAYYGGRAARIESQLYAIVPILSQIHGLVTHMADHAGGLVEVLGGMTGPEAAEVRMAMEKTRAALVAVDLDFESAMNSLDSARFRANATAQLTTPHLMTGDTE